MTTSSRRTAFTFVLAMVIAGCTEQTVVGNVVSSSAPNRTPENSMGAVAAIPGAAIIAVGGSQQIVPRVMSVAGQELFNYDRVTYQLNSVGDTAFVLLSSSGLVHGLQPTVATVKVNVFVTKDGVTKGDQVLISVTPVVVPNLLLTWFISSDPRTGDSTRLAFGTKKDVRKEIVLLNTQNAVAIPNPAVRLSVNAADAARLSLYTPSLAFGGSPITVQPANGIVGETEIYANAQNGVAWLYMSTTAYGRQLRDSILYTLLFPIQGVIEVDITGLGLTSPYRDQTLNLSSGAVVSFTNGTPLLDGIALTFTFDNPSFAMAPLSASLFGGASGNTTPMVGNQTASRRFLVCAVCPLETVKWTAAAVAGVPPWGGQTISGTIRIPP